mgnify:CR=1 FL=1
MVERPQAGQPLKLSAKALGDAYEAGEWYANRKRLGQGLDLSLSPVNPAVVRVRNDSGGDLTAGAVIEIGQPTLTSLARKSLWFSAAARSGNDPVCAVLLESIPEDKYGDAQLAGVCLADVDIDDIDHTHARVVPGSTRLQSDFGGWCRLLYPAASAGDGQRVAVLLGDYGPTIRKAKASGTITAGSSGTANVWINGASRGSVTAYLDWMDSAGNIGSNTEILIQYFHDQDRWQVVGAECST